MVNAYYLIIIYITIVSRMVFAEVNSQKLGHLLSKLLRYDYLAENYKLALQKQAIPFGITL